MVDGNPPSAVLWIVVGCFGWCVVGELQQSFFDGSLRAGGGVEGSGL